MKHFYVLLLLICLPLASAMAQPRYSVEKIPLCWTVGSTDSSITKVVLISSASDQMVTIGYYNADGDDVTVSGGTLQYGYCGTGGGGGGGDDDWRWYGAVETYAKPLYRIGKTNIFVTAAADTTHGFRVDSTFQFRMYGGTNIFDWQVGGGTGTDYTPHAGLFYRAPNTFESSLVGAGQNNLTIGAADNSISDRDRIGALIFAGKNPAGTGGYRPGAMITAFADVPGGGGWTSDSSATSLNFYITRPNQNTLTNVFTMQRDGRFEMDRYQFFEDGVPERLLGFDDGTDDATVHTIAGTAGANSLLGLNSTGSGMEWKGSGDIIQQEIRLLVNQTGHGFTLPSYGFKPVYKSQVDGKWRAASTTADSTLHNGFVVEIVDANSFWVQTTGIFQTASNHGLTDARDYFLQDGGTIGTSADVTYNDWVATVLDSNHVDLKTLHVFQSDTSSVIGNQTLSFNSGTGEISIANGNTVDLDGRWLQGSLNSGRVPRATGATTVTDGTIRDDGTNIGIAQAAGTGRLEVTGAGTGTGVTMLLQSSAGTDNVTVADNGTVGIGVAPVSTAKLLVQGINNASTDFAAIFENLSLSDILQVRNDAYVGINNATITERLSVKGGIFATTTGGTTIFRLRESDGATVFGTDTPSGTYRVQIRGFGATGSTYTLRLFNSAGTTVGVFRDDATAGIGVDASGNAFLSLGATTTSKASLNIPSGTAPSSPTTGDIWHNSSTATLQSRIAGINQSLAGVVFTGTANASISNSTTETSITPTGVGSLTLPASFFVAGKSIRVCASGTYTTAGAAPTLLLKFKFGSTTLLATSANTMNASANGSWEAEYTLTCRTTGASGTSAALGSLDFSSAETVVDKSIRVPGTPTIDTTVSNAVSITAQWGTADASNAITTTQLTFEVIN